MVKHIELLLKHFDYGINTDLISPRPWGKSSLVEKASEEAKNRFSDIVIVKIDLFNIRTEEVLKQPDEILDLAEKIATSKKMRTSICIDEFKNIGFFDDPLATQKKLRANRQAHT